MQASPIAMDAFGNALGSSLAEQMRPTVKASVGGMGPRQGGEVTGNGAPISYYTAGGAWEDQQYAKMYEELGPDTRYIVDGPPAAGPSGPVGWKRRDTAQDGTVIYENLDPADSQRFKAVRDFDSGGWPTIDGHSPGRIEVWSGEGIQTQWNRYYSTSVAPVADTMALPVDSANVETAAARDAFERPTGLSILLSANATTKALYTPIHSEGAYGVARGVPGYQAHHLNQNAIYKNFGIPESAGFSINIRGNALNEAGSAHYEAHASLEQWWSQYRRGGEKFGEVPTNGQVGEASRRSLVDAGLDPAAAQRVSDIARQQRISAGHAEAAPVPRIPGRVVQSPTSTVDETLWKTRRVATGLQWGGRALTAYGAAMDAASLYSEVQTSRQTGNYGNTVNESVRIAGGWGGAWAVGAAGAEFGAGFGLAFGPVGALVGGFAGGVVGGAIGYSMGSYAAQGIYADMRRW
ncbi:hypothetical protein [Massilia sp. YIM B04103]|uniref:hypothetical protein n=1 Tax=Massilia sp. YIM B04103 TaxID=2963106 RepID=UPI00210993F8|nr:hypothetical protein [Massilia sp. YIM B04103]